MHAWIVASFNDSNILVTMYPTGDSLFDRALRQMLQNQIRPDEKLVWSDQPVPRVFTCGSVGLMLFGIPFTAFSVFWIAMALTASRFSTASDQHSFSALSLCFPLFGLPFFLAGLGLITSPIWIARAMKKTIYAITTQRAIVCRQGIFGRIRVQSFEPARLTRMERRERPDGTGDLIFEEFTTGYGSGASTTRRGFFSVRHVRDVENLLHQTLVAGKVRQVPPPIG